MRAKIGFCAAVCAAVFLAGCNTNRIAPVERNALEDYVAEIQSRQAVEAGQPQPPAGQEFRKTELPPDALFLGTARRAHFDTGFARDVIRALAAPHPVLFSIESSANPTVSAPSGAVTLKDWLDSIAVQADWDYQVENGVIVFRDWASRVIPLAALAGTSTAELKTTTGSALTEQVNQLDVATDAYAEIEGLVQRILGVEGSEVISAGDEPRTIEFENEDGTVQELALDPSLEALLTPQTDERSPQFSVSRAANFLFVSARPNQVREVMQVVEQHNARVSKRAVINITIYDVVFREGEDRRLDLNVLRNAARGLNLKLGSPTAVNDTLSIVRTSEPAARGWSQELILRWVESSATVSDRTERRFEVANNRAVTFLDTTEISYIKNISAAAITDTLATETVEIGAHQLGQAFTVYVSIVGDRVNMQLATNNRRVREQRPNTRGGTLYDIDNIDRMIPMTLVDGETRILMHTRNANTRTTLARNRILPVVGDEKDDSEVEGETVIVISVDIVG